MTGIQTLVVATGNRHKLAELSELLASRKVTVVGQNTLAIESVAETESTFEGNALLKARHAAKLSGHWALADDSGLCVDVLAGAPGVYSARYAGEHANDAANNRKLIQTLQAYPHPWRAHYVACLVLVAPALNRPPIVATGTWEGTLIEVPRGSGGFGYDPHFVPDADPHYAQNARVRTAAELSAVEKNQISHRAKALQQLLALWPLA